MAIYLDFIGENKMKRNILALAVGTAIAMPGVALADAATIYGRMDLSLDRVSIDNDTGMDDTGSNWEVNSKASRFGVKGDVDLGNGFTALYKVEWQVDGDGSSDTLKARNRYVGLSGGFGTVLLGRMDTPLKSAQGKVDLFDNWTGDITNVLIGEYRANNVIAYAAPKIADVITLTIAFPQIEQNEADGCTTKYDGAVKDGDDCEDGLFDVISASAVYNKDGIYAAVAIDQAVPATGAANTEVNAGFTASDFLGVARFDTIRLIGAYTMGNMQFGVIYSTSEENGDYINDVIIPAAGADPAIGVRDEVEVDGYLLNGAFTLGKNVLKAQYGVSSYDLGVEGSKDVDVSLLSLGVDHNFTKQTMVYANYNMREIDDKNADSSDPSKDTLSIGMRHKF